MQPHDDASLDAASADRGNGPGGASGDEPEAAGAPATGHGSRGRTMSAAQLGGVTSRIMSGGRGLRAAAASVRSGGARRLGRYRRSVARLAARGGIAARDAIRRPVRLLVVVRREWRARASERAHLRSDVPVVGG